MNAMDGVGCGKAAFIGADSGPFQYDKVGNCSLQKEIKKNQ